MFRPATLSFCGSVFVPFCGFLLCLFVALFCAFCDYVRDSVATRRISGANEVFAANC